MTVAPGAIGAGTEIGQGYTLKDGSGCLTIRVHLRLLRVPPDVHLNEKPPPLI